MTAFSLNRDALAKAFSLLAAVVPARSPKPILSNVLLRGGAGQPLCLSATDLEIALVYQLDGEAPQQPIDLLLPERRMAMILRECDDAEELRFEKTGPAEKPLTIQAGSSRFVLPQEPAAEYPAMQSFDAGKPHFDLGAGPLALLLERTQFAAGSESSRYSLGGVYFEFSPGELTAVATDGRRLSKLSAPISARGAQNSQPPPAIIPLKLARVLERVLAAQAADSGASLQIEHSAALFRVGGTALSGRLLEGRFPKWRDVLPPAGRVGEQRFQLTAGTFAAAIRRAAIMTSEESLAAEFRFGCGQLSIGARAAELGESRVQLPVACEGAEVTISLNVRYLLDWLKTLAPEQPIGLTLRSGDDAALFDSCDGGVYVVMPLARDH